MTERGPWVSPCPDDQRPSPGPSLADSVKELTIVVGRVADAQRRKRWTDAVIAIYAVILGVFVLLYYFVELPGRRDAINDRISDLACTAVAQRPPGFSATYDRIRKTYDCPPYNPASTPDINNPSVVPPTRIVPGPTVTRTPAPAATVTRTPGPQAPQPGATTTRTRTVTVAPRAATKTVVRPGRTVTVTATPTCVLRVVVGVVCP